MSLIPADQPLAVVAGLAGLATAGFLIEKTRWGATLTGTVWVILLAIVASNVGAIPKASPAYDFVFAYVTPILIPLFLIKADLKRILFETTRMTGAFLLAALGTVVGVTLAFGVLDLGAPEAGIAGAFTATYIGGSVNYAALIDITGLREDPSFVSAATAVDNMASALFLGLLASLPAWRWLAGRYVAKDHTQGSEADEAAPAAPSALSLIATLAFALAVVSIANAIVAAGDAWLARVAPERAGLFAGYLRYVIITVLALIPATAAPKLMARLSGGYELGLGLAFVFFAAIAAGADVPALLAAAPILIPAVVIILAGHSAVLFGLGSLLKFSLPELITASNASILGATTAPALAAAKGWRDLVTPGVLVGVLGYVIGTPIAIAMYAIWRAMAGG
jgi:uncharacterized membrane protein